jgi:hypothetical protein
MVKSVVTFALNPGYAGKPFEERWVDVFYRGRRVITFQPRDVNVKLRWDNFLGKPVAISIMSSGSKYPFQTIDLKEIEEEWRQDERWRVLEEKYRELDKRLNIVESFLIKKGLNIGEEGALD